jgi:hypothetical protein
VLYIGKKLGINIRKGEIGEAIVLKLRNKGEEERGKSLDQRMR